jgi:hypothetical protein
MNKTTVIVLMCLYSTTFVTFRNPMSNPWWTLAPCGSGWNRYVGHISSSILGVVAGRLVLDASLRIRGLIQQMALLATLEPWKF